MNISTLLLLTSNSLLYSPRNDNTFKFDDASIAQVTVTDNNIYSKIFNVYDNHYAKEFNLTKTPEFRFQYIFRYRSSAIIVLKSNVDNASVFHFLENGNSLHSYVSYDIIRYNHVTDELFFYKGGKIYVYPLTNFILIISKGFPLKPTRFFITQTKWEDFHFFDSCIIYKWRKSVYVYPNIFVSQKYDIYFSKIETHNLLNKKFFCFLLSFFLFFMHCFR